MKSTTICQHEAVLKVALSFPGGAIPDISTIGSVGVPVKVWDDSLIFQFHYVLSCKVAFITWDIMKLKDEGIIPITQNLH